MIQHAQFNIHVIESSAFSVFSLIITAGSGSEGKMLGPVIVASSCFLAWSGLALTENCSSVCGGSGAGGALGKVSTEFRWCHPHDSLTAFQNNFGKP